MSILHPRPLGGLRLFAAPALLFFAAAEGCQILSGLSDLEPRQEAATTAATTCERGSVQDCYTGPDETKGVGICTGGTQTCKTDGSGWEACVDEVTPSPEPENCAGGDDLNCDGKATCTGAVAWAHLVNGAGKIVAHAAAVNSKGEAIIGGLFAGKVDFGGMAISSADLEPDAFVAKLDQAGAVKWVKTFGGAGDDAVVSVAVAKDDSILITGHFTTTISFDIISPNQGQGSGDIFVAKLDTEGSTIWGKTFGDAGVQGAHGVTTDADGNVVISGHFTGNVVFGSGPMSAATRDGFVAKLTSAGDPLWGKQIAGGDIEEGYGVAVDSAGDVVVTGMVSYDVNFGGKAYLGNGGVGIFVGKLGGSSGMPMWAKSFGAPNPYQLGISAARAGADGEGWSSAGLAGAASLPPISTSRRGTSPISSL
jgi:hypothetical protein